MTSATPATPALGGFFDRARSVAPAGYNRWLVPPCALAMHLSIGMAYGFSVFWLPLSRALGVAKPVTCPGMTLAQAITTTTCDWRVSDLVWTYSIFFVVLGAAAAVWGGWLERVGPRKAGAVAAFCWAGGIAIGALGVSWHQLWLVWLGTGLIGGIGLGLGYISPVSTLIKWFPDRRGLATGMAIMGFGGGAMIGSPLADQLMKHFTTAHDVGVWPTFLVLAALYFVAMMAGAIGYRVPREDWSPAGWTAPVGSGAFSAGGGAYVHLDDAHKTVQFWLIWAVLLLNVSASIGIIGVASPMVQEVFGGRLIGQPLVAFAALDATQKAAVAAIGAGFVGVISLFNIAGRFFWATSSDRLGRKVTYAIMTALGAVLYGLAAPALIGGSVGLFILVFCICASMYGGGFATVPAYLADVFGTRFVGAIHGRLLTAWSTAGVLGPLIVTTLRDHAIAAKVPAAHVYPPIYWALGGLLVAAFVINLLIRPVDPALHRYPEETALDYAADAVTGDVPAAHPAPAGLTTAVAIAWLLVLLPIGWGIWQTAAKAAVLLR
jgi:MFS family permease